eukprot:scaffold1231_cov369-Prasinococcus_capsulatus_cf.AAC.5
MIVPSLRMVISTKAMTGSLKACGGCAGSEKLVQQTLTEEHCCTASVGVVSLCRARTSSH